MSRRIDRRRLRALSQLVGVRLGLYREGEWRVRAPANRNVPGTLLGFGYTRAEALQSASRVIGGFR